MTELLLLFGLAVSGLFLVDPFFGGALTKSGPAKLAVLVLVLGPLLVHAFGRMHGAPERWRRSLVAVLRQWWPALLLGLLIVGGSLYAREVKQVRETFLNFGLGLLFLPLMALAVDVSARQRLLLRGLLVLYLATCAAMLGVAAARLHVLHEQIFWAAPVGLYFLAARRPGWAGHAAGLALVGSSLVAFKNTTFLVVLTCLGTWLAVVLLRVGRQRDRLRAFVGAYFTVLAVLLLATAGALLWWHVRETLPHGNTQYRIEMYALAWQRFLQSPLWGDLFTEPSVTYFSLYRVAVSTQYLPTHSDILDLLAHGGLIAAGLWLATVGRILAIALRAIATVARRPADDDDRAWRWLLVLALAQVGAIVTYAINPPLIRLVDGLWIWGGAGVLWALHRHLVTRPEELEAAAPRRRGGFARPGVQAVRTMEMR